MQNVSEYTVYVKRARRWGGRVTVRSVALAILALWLFVNLATAYGAANPWVTDLLSTSDDPPGRLADVIPGTPVDTRSVIGHFAPPTGSRGTVVVVHGHGGDRNAFPVRTASQWLVDDGWGVLAIDLGYLHGRHRYTAGPREALDISAAIDWLEEQGQDVAGVWGFSAGAHASLVAASRDPRIPVVISDSAFADGIGQIRSVAAATWHLPKVALPLVGPGVRLFSGDRPVDVRSSPWPGTPVLVIHGTADDAVPISDARALCEHIDCELLVLSGVAHTEGHVDAPAKYRRAALDLLERSAAS